MALVHDYGVEPGERVQAQHLRPQLIVQDVGILQQQRLQLLREWARISMIDPLLYCMDKISIKTPNPKCRLFLKKVLSARRLSV